MKTLMNKQHGGVSIFIVIFTALLLTVVTTSFVRIMILNQQQASNNDLSQSAYDAAMAGVEDAKRALVAMRACEKKSDCDQVTQFYSHMDDKASCESLKNIGIVEFNNGEVPVGSEAQNQAYTCVKINRLTKDFQPGRAASGGDPLVVPLRGVEPFTKVRVSWFQSGEGKDIATDKIATLMTPTNATTLPSNASWPATQPPLLRTQLIQFNKTKPIDIDSFNDIGTPNSRTLFLMPSTISSVLDFGSDNRRQADATNNLRQVECTTDNLSTQQFACRATIDLVDPKGASATEREAYLALSAIYNSAHIKIELLDKDNNVVNFNGVQPTVDSTGRSADQFRRVQANVELKDGPDSGLYPDAALKVANKLCKNFFVTNDEGDYNTSVDGKECSP